MSRGADSLWQIPLAETPISLSQLFRYLLLGLLVTTILVKKQKGPGFTRVPLFNSLIDLSARLLAGALEVETGRAINRVDEIFDAGIEGGCILGIALGDLCAHFVLEGLNLIHAGLCVTAVE